MKRAYSVVRLKDVSEDLRVIRGTATTPSVDRVGDIVEPMGVRAGDEIPLFLYHDSSQTVGRARLGKPTKDGIPFEARLPHVREPGRLKDRVDEAWQMLKYGLITGVSIGFNVLNNAYECMKDGGYRFLETEVLELSLVPIPANSEATINTVKALAKAADPSADFNDADVSFAVGMMRGQAAMRDMMDSHMSGASNDDMKAMAKQAMSDGAAMMDQMSAWMRDHGMDDEGHMMGGGSGGMGGDGKGAAAKVAKAADGADHSASDVRMAVGLMRAHQKTVDMSNAEMADGKNKRMTGMARSMKSTATSGMEKTRSWLRKRGMDEDGQSMSKSTNGRDPAALGRQGSPPGDRHRPGASGQQQQAASGRLFHSRSQKGNTVKTLKELLELRATKAARMDEITKAWDDKDHERTDDERNELDALTEDIGSLDDDIRIARMHQIRSAGAREVAGGNSDEGSRSRGPTIIVRKTDPDDKFPGQSFTRRLIARAAAYASMKDGNFVAAADIAQARWGKTHPKLVQVIRAGVAGGGTGSGEWGAELAQSDERYTGDFITFLYSKTIFDKLPLREVPARINVKGQDGAATGYWVGESKGIPVSKPDFSSVELTPLKVAALAVCSKELLTDSTPAAEMFIRDSIAEASAQKVDTTFLSADAASAGVSPAGLLNGVSAFAPSGTDEAAVRADMQTLAYPFVTAKMASGLMFVMNPAQGLALGSFVNTFSQPAFPGINEEGGTFMGRRALTGDNVTAGDIILLRPQDIWKIGDTGIEVSMSDQATIEQDSAPQGAGDTPTAASATLMSLWQTEQVGFKVVRRINFQKRRTGAVQVISNAEYGGVTS